jgi:hypothetical protein
VRLLRYPDGTSFDDPSLACSYTRYAWQAGVRYNAGLILAANRRVMVRASPTSVSIELSRADNLGRKDGTADLAGFDRYFVTGDSVTLTASASDSAGGPFQKWLKNGADYSGNRSIPITVTAVATYSAVYGPPPDTTAPTPDPSTWATKPYATDSTSIGMVATTAGDPSGVEYYFACVAGGGHNSGWQDSASYEDTGLQPNTTYGYRVRTRDGSANQNTGDWSIPESATTSSVPDTTPPTATIRGPTSSPSYTTAGATIDIGGTAWDNIDVTQVSWSNDRGGSGPCDGTTDWSKTGISLRPGPNAITVTAKDAAGNSGTDTLTVTYTPPDTTPPVMHISSPTNGQSFASSPITVSGTASDLGSPSSGVALDEVQVNSGAWQTASGTTSWSKPVSLLPGSNLIEARSKDGAGNYSALDSVTVTYSPPPKANVCPNRTPTTTPGTLDGSCSTGNIVAYTWFENGRQIAGGEVVEVQLSHGTHEITLEVTDAEDRTARDTAKIEVAVEEHDLTLLLTGPGIVRANGETVLSSDEGQTEARLTFADGTEVFLEADETEMCDEFVGWRGDAGSSERQVTIVMNGDKTITAEFRDGQPRIGLCGAASCTFGAVLVWLGCASWNQRKTRELRRRHKARPMRPAL